MRGKGCEGERETRQEEKPGNKKKKKGEGEMKRASEKRKRGRGEDTTTQVTASFCEIGNRPSSRKCLVTHNGFTLEFECNQ